MSKKVSLYILYLLFYLIYNLSHSENFFNGSDMRSFIIGGAIVVISISLYFIELLTVDRVMDFKSSFNLIVLGALFVWWLVIAPTLFYSLTQAIHHFKNYAIGLT